MDKTDLTVELIKNAMCDASALCDQWCRNVDYGYTFSDLVAVTKLIIELDLKELERS